MQILAVVTPIVIGGAVLAAVFIANYFDDKKGEAERKALSLSRNDDPPRSASAAE